MNAPRRPSPPDIGASVARPHGHPTGPAARTLDTVGRRARSITTRALAVAVAIGLVVALPAVVLAHPLGNFTINHYAEVRVETDRILLDVVIDQAEIPTFQARFDFDLDGDASLSDEEIDAGRVTACEGIGRSLVLTADGGALTPRLTRAGLSFPLGAGGLATMREVCSFEAPLIAALTDVPTKIAFRDGSFQERLGWREIVARGSGATLKALDGELRDTGISDRLRQYPPDRVASPLADAALLVGATVGGPTLPPVSVPDATPVLSADPSPVSSAAPPAATAPANPVPAVASQIPVPAVVPGGVTGGEVPDIFRAPDLTPFVVLLSLVTAVALGAGHALTPGHGKTLMAAYLVGTRGSARHALGLGAAVSLSHTIGILALAAVVVAATDVIAPDVVVRWAPVVAAVSIVVIGGWMLVGEIQRRRAMADDHQHAHGHAHPHEHGDPHAHDQGHEHPHPHAHRPPSTITWRSLFVLGLAGGLIPSTSALLILLGAIAAGRPTFGLVLVVAFGLGMAAVMSGIGLVLVTARDRVDRVQAGASLVRVRNAVPLVASVVVLGFGVVLTGQALAVIRPLGL
jgi:nickel/cobalt transporter (NicO) family protein